MKLQIKLVLHRENSRFRAETDEGQQEHEFQQFFHPADFFRVQHAAEDKVRCRAVVDDEHQRNERQRRAGDGEGEVLAPCADGHGVLLVDDKRQGNQRQALIKDVEREQVRRERDGQRDGVAHRVVAEERVRTLLVLHVLKAVQRRQRPEDGYQPSENAAHAVHAERQRQLAVHVAEDVGGIRKEPIDPTPVQTKVKTKRRKNVSISNVAGARTYSIESEQDIDKFLAEMKQKLMNELEEDTIITLS